MSCLVLGAISMSVGVFSMALACPCFEEVDEDDEYETIRNKEIVRSVNRGEGHFRDCFRPFASVPWRLFLTCVCA